MKKITYFAIAIFILCACGQNGNDGYKIRGKITGAGDTTKIILKEYSANGYITVDTSILLNSTFNFKGKVSLPEMFRIVVNGYDDYIPVFVENSEIVVEADTNRFDKAKITGSVSDKIYKHLMATIDSIDSQSQTIYDSIKIAGKTNNVAKIQALEEKLATINKKEDETMVDFVKGQPQSTVSVYVLYKYLSGELDLSKTESLSAAIDTSLHQSIYYQLLEKQIDILRKTEIGQPAINFSLPGTKGDSVQLSSLFGKYLLIDFWASWCQPCRKENPNVVKAYHLYSAKGFNVLGVSLDNKRENWLQAIHDDKLEWNHVSDLKGWGNSAAQLYGVRAIPSNFLLSPKGVIIAKNLRGNDLQKKLNEILH